MRSNYWSCSAFADWLRGTPKIKMGTGKQWSQWTKASKENHPIRYWLAEEGLDAVQNFVNWPSDRINDVRYYINNRWVVKSHALTAHPRDIKPGSWRDVGDRFLPCLFNELVDFVEVEQAWHHVLWDDEARKKYEAPWWQRNWYTRLGTRWRSAEAGLAYLDWASARVLDEDWGTKPGDPNYGKPTHQALAAQEIKALYTWWKDVYPNRPDPYEASGWSAHCDSLREAGGSLFDFESRTPEVQERGNIAHKLSQEMEDAYEKEDEEMLIRLIKIRNSLWT